MMPDDETPSHFYEIRLSEPAETDIEATVLRMAVFSHETAERRQAEILAACQSLSQMPRRCLFAPENGLYDRPIRQLLYRSGRTVYRILFTFCASFTARSKDLERAGKTEAEQQNESN